MSNIKLEPHKVFKKAIVKVGNQGRLEYGYYLLIDVCQDHYNLEYEDAVEWVDYNICGLAPNGFSISYNENETPIDLPKAKPRSLRAGNWKKRKVKKS
jgi:hypothetical protein